MRPFSDCAQSRRAIPRRYGFSKLCNVLFAQELTRRWRDDIVGVSVHPASSLLTQQEGGAWFARAWCWACSFWNIAPEQAATTTLYGALSEDPAVRAGGTYLVRAAVSDVEHPDARDPVKAAALWNHTERIFQAMFT